DPSIRLWDLATRREARRFPGHRRGVRALAFSPDGKTLASAGGRWEEEARQRKDPDPCVRLWDVETGQQRRALDGHHGGARAVAFSPDGAALATGDGKVVRLWDLASGRERRLSVGSDQGVEALAFIGGKRLVSAGTDGVLRVWDAATGRCLV